jgi:hypothetical protein
MIRPVKYFSLSLLICLVSLFMTIPVMAIPPAMPSSFYGTLKVNGENVPDGNLVQALINGQVVAKGYTQTYQGDSVYAMDIPGDDTDTGVQDGGRENDTIKFEIGGAMADQTGVWHTGTNVNLNLTASTSEPVATPQATPTPVPTHTAIVLIQPSPMPTTISQASLTPTTLVQPSQVASQPSQPSPMPTTISQASLTPTTLVQPSQVASQPSQPSPMPTIQVQPSLTSVASENDKDNGSGNITQVVVSILALIVAIIVGYMFLVSRKKKM